MKIMQCRQDVDFFPMISRCFLTCCADGFHRCQRCWPGDRSWNNDSPTLRRSQTETSRIPGVFLMVDLVIGDITMWGCQICQEMGYPPK